MNYNKDNYSTEVQKQQLRWLRNICCNRKACDRRNCLEKEKCKPGVHGTTPIRLHGMVYERKFFIDGINGKFIKKNIGFQCFSMWKVGDRGDRQEQTPAKPASAFFYVKNKKDSKKRQKKKNIRHINIKHKKNLERRKCFER